MMMKSDSSKIIINNAMNWYEIITSRRRNTHTNIMASEM